MTQYFGTDGIRGVYGETLTLAMAYHIGRALKLVFKVDEAFIASDTRASKDALKQALAAGAASQGVTLYDAGILPTPALALYAEQHRCVTIMVTASHNPYTDNGIKIFDRGAKLTQATELDIEALFQDPAPDTLEMALETTNVVEAFYHARFSAFQASSLTVTLDCANGALYALGPRYLSPHVAHCQSLHTQPNGKNINLNCGSTHLESLIEAMKTRPTDVGFAFDGDGDRVLAVDAEGRVYTGDHLIYVLAKHYHSLGQLPHNSIALTVMSNPGILASYQKEGIDVVQTPVGDKHISAAIKNEGLALGGEASGHIIDKHYGMTGDGLYIAHKIIAIMHHSNQTLAELTSTLTFYPEMLTNHRHLDPAALEKEAFQKRLKQHRNDFGDEGTILVRKSGTESLVRLYVSHRNEARMHAVHQELLQALTE